LCFSSNIARRSRHDADVDRPGDVLGDAPRLVGELASSIVKTRAREGDLPYR
jgi:hypothetical protein